MDGLKLKKSQSSYIFHIFNDHQKLRHFFSQSIFIVHKKSCIMQPFTQTMIQIRFLMEAQILTNGATNSGNGGSNSGLNNPYELDFYRTTPIAWETARAIPKANLINIK